MKILCFVFAVLCALLIGQNAQGFFCSSETLTHTGMSVITKGSAHVYYFSGKCTVTGYGVAGPMTESVKASWDGKAAAREEISATGLCWPAGSDSCDQYKAVIQYSCPDDPWLNPSAACTVSSCTQQKNTVPKDCLNHDELKKARPTTKALLAKPVKWTFDGALKVFEFVTPASNAVMSGGTQTFEARLGKELMDLIKAEWWPGSPYNVQFRWLLSSGAGGWPATAWSQKSPLPDKAPLGGPLSDGKYVAQVSVKHSDFPAPGVWQAQACIKTASYSNCVTSAKVDVKPPAIHVDHNQQRNIPSVMKPVGAMPPSQGTSGRTAPGSASEPSRRTPGASPGATPPRLKLPGQ